MKARDLIVDGHEDIAFNSLYLHRDFLVAAHDKRQDRVDDKNGNPTVGLPDLVKGNVRIVFATIWVPPCLPEVDEKPCYSTAKEAYDLGRQQLDYYETLASQDHVTLIRTRKDLESVVQNRTRVGLVLLMEGADPIMAPENASDWYLDGLRIVAPSWRATRYAGGTHMPGPLTQPGRELMKELERANLVLDVSHMTDEGFFEALDHFHGTVIASHSNCRALVPTERHLSDEMIRALVSRDGVMGMVFNNPFLLKDWEQMGHVKSQVTLKQVVQHIQHVCAIARDTKHVAIGSDLDGGFGVEKTPAEVDTVSDLWKLGHALSSEGFSDEDVQGILHGNWLRVLEGALPP